MRNLPFNISSEEMYEIFGRYGAIRQIRMCARTRSPRGAEAARRAAPRRPIHPHATRALPCAQQPPSPAPAPPCLPRRSGTNKETRGTAYVVFEDIHDAKQACDHLSGFNVQNRRARTRTPAALGHAACRRYTTPARRNPTAPGSARSCCWRAGATGHAPGGRAAAMRRGGWRHPPRDLGGGPT